jgi:hypothetical protein
MQYQVTNVTVYSAICVESPHLLSHPFLIICE